MLLIHHHQPQLLELHRILEQGMGAHQQVQLAVGQILQQLAPSAGGGGTREQGTVHLQLRQPVGELGEVLLGQHLGGGHQGSLAAGGDRREQGRQGHHGLAAAYIALHQPGHRLGAHQVGADLRQHALLGAGEGEGQQVEEAGHQVVGVAGQGERGRRPAPQPLAPQAQGQLQQQELVEHQAMAPALERLAVGGLVDARQGLAPRRQPQPGDQWSRQRVGPVTDPRQQGLHRLTQPVGGEALGEGVDRHQPADLLGAHHRPGRVEHLDQGIAEAGAVGALLHQAAHHHRGAEGKLALLGLQPARGGEPAAGEEAADPQASGDVLQMQFQDRELGIARTGEGVAAAHRGHDRGGAARLQGGDAHAVGVVEVVAGEVMQQIPHHQQAQSRQPGGGAGADAGNGGQGIVGGKPGGHGPGSRQPAGRGISEPQAGGRHGLRRLLGPPQAVEGLAQALHQPLPLGQRLLGVGGEARLQRRQGAPLILRQPGRQLLEAAAHETAEGLPPSEQVLEAALRLQARGLLQRRAPGLRRRVRRRSRGQSAGGRGGGRSCSQRLSAWWMASRRCRRRNRPAILRSSWRCC